MSQRTNPYTFMPWCPGALVLQSTSRALPEHHNPYKEQAVLW
jgi:hypothetical protein